MDTLPISPFTEPSSRATSAQPGGSESSGVISSDFETFLTMLTTQMENQDPLNPMDSSDFAVQLATFSGVEQQVLGNDLLRDLGSQMGVMNLSQLSGWVGMEARTSGPVHFTGTPLTLHPEIPASADKATIVVRDPYGREVNRVPLSPRQDKFVWDGKDAAGARLENGNYNFSVQSSSGNVLLDTTKVYSYARVEEVRHRQGVTELVLSGNRVLPSSEVNALRQP